MKNAIIAVLLVVNACLVVALWQPASRIPAPGGSAPAELAPPSTATIPALAAPPAPYGPATAENAADPVAAVPTPTQTPARIGHVLDPQRVAELREFDRALQVWGLSMLEWSGFTNLPDLRQR